MFCEAARRWKREGGEERKMNGRVGVSAVHRAQGPVTVTVSKVRVHREKNQSPGLKGGPKETGRPAQGEKDGNSPWRLPA